MPSYYFRDILLGDSVVAGPNSQDPGRYMKIGETQPVTGAVAPREHAARDGVPAPERAGTAPRDTASVMGIPAEELSPQVRSAVMTLMGEVDRLKRDLEQSRKRLREMEDVADQDPLVPMLNRRAFERELARTQSYTKRYGAKASLVFIDLDGFKEVNDVYGHAAGDAVLKRVALLLIENVRQSDVVGRLGGDEFGLILMQTGVEMAEQKAASLLEVLAGTPVEFEGAELSMSASAGTSSVDETPDIATALARADLAMYEHKAKNGG